MTVIAIQIKASPNQADSPSTTPSPGPPSWVGALADRVGQNVVGKHAEALADDRSPMSAVGGLDLADHARGLYRFESTESIADVLDTIEADVVADAEWYRLESHECDHDETGVDRDGCPSWSIERESGSVPGGI